MSLDQVVRYAQAEHSAEQTGYAPVAPEQVYQREIPRPSILEWVAVGAVVGAATQHLEAAAVTIGAGYGIQYAIDMVGPKVALYVQKAAGRMGKEIIRYLNGRVVEASIGATIFAGSTVAYAYFSTPNVDTVSKCVAIAISIIGGAVEGYLFKGLFTTPDPSDQPSLSAE